MASYYTTEQVDPFMKAASTLAHNLLEKVAGQEEELGALRQELATLKAASENKVSLEKVSAAGVTREKADELTSVLVANGVINSDMQSKYASAFTSNPAFLADVAIRLFETPATQGRGIDKAAFEADGPSAEEAEELRKEREAWARALRS